MKSHDQSKGFAIITTSQHVTKELVKLNGVQFQGNLKMQCQKMKIPAQRTTYFLVNVNYADTVKSVKQSLTGHTQNRVIIFVNSIT